MDKMDKKLLFIIPTLAKGGAERVLAVLSNHLNGYKKDIVVFENKIDYEVDGNIINLDIPASESILIKIKNFFKRWKKLRELKKNNYIASISFLENANILNIIAKPSKKVIISIRAHIAETFEKDPFLFTGPKRRLLVMGYGLLLKLLYPRADLIVAVSQGVKESLIKLGVPEEKIKVIYNPYPIEEIRESAKEPVEEVFEKAEYVITTGRLTKQKGQWYLLRVFRELKKSYPELKLLILGDGELKSYLVKLSQNLGLKTYVWDRDKLSENFDVYFLGFKKNPFKYVSRARLFVFPSLWEGFGNVLVEAMACGVPVISSDCKSGPREILAPKTDFRYQTKKPEFAEYGVLMPVFEDRFLDAFEPLTEKERLWVEVIKKMLEDENLRKEYSEKALKRAYDFHVDKIIKEWEEILR